MVADWSVECSANDPVLVVPWKDPNGHVAFVDLRENPYDFDHVPEAERYPPLLDHLRVLNAPRSPVFTAKCDVWPLEHEELAQMQFDLCLAEPPGTGIGSYVDIVWRNVTAFRSFTWHEQQLVKLVRLAKGIDLEVSELEFVLRPALLDLGITQEGYSITVYVRAGGDDQASATQEWTDALSAVSSILRQGLPALSRRAV